MIHTFILIWCFYHLLGLFVAETNGVKTVPVMAGDSVTLETITDIQGYDKIEWRSGNIRIARIKEVNGIFSTYYSDDRKFIDRLHLDNQTGSLTIRNSTTEHTGVYELRITVSGVESIKSYRVNVYAPLPTPVIFIDTLQYLSSSERSSRSKFVLLCSVMDVSHVTLSWYKGNVLSSINVSDLSISLSLPLEVEYQDKNTYSCVVSNPLSNKTTHLDISGLNWLSSDPVHYCCSPETVIRLVVSALMGVAAVVAIVVLVYDIKSRTGEERTKKLNIKN